MATLQLASKAKKMTGVVSKPGILYRSILKELPQVMMIYDIMDRSEESIKKTIKLQFYDKAHIRDEKVQQMLLDQGYYHLEDTLLQHKQKTQLMYLLEGMEGDDRLRKRKLTADEDEDDEKLEW